MIHKLTLGETELLKKTSCHETVVYSSTPSDTPVYLLLTDFEPGSSKPGL